MSTVKAAWKRIKTWYKKNVEAENFSLASGATVKDIKAAESDLGLQFPRDVIESYRLHNGSNECAIFPYGFHLLSLDQVVTNWKMWRGHVEQGVFNTMQPNPKGPIKKVWWGLNWVPITHNAGGDHQCIDMDPATGGTVGQVIKFSHEVGAQLVLATSLESWLLEFAAALEHDRYRFDSENLWLVPISAKESNQ